MTATTTTTAITPSERDNALRFVAGDRGGHIESHFLKATAPDAARAFWIRHTILAPRGRPDLAVAEIWAMAFDRRVGSKIAAVKITRPIGEARYQTEPFQIDCAGVRYSAGRARGEVAGSGHAFRWDLSFDPRGPSFHPFPLERMYTAPLPKSKTLTPYPDVRFDGTVLVDGESWDVAGWPGMQGHNWGRQNAHTYAWAHCNQWDEAPSGAVWFEGLSAKVKLGPVLTPWLSCAAVHLEDETVRFDGARAMTSRAVDMGWYRWRFTLEHKHARLVGDIDAERSDLAGLRYENPDASTTYCLNSKLARGHLRLERPGRAPVELRSRGFALELGTKDPDHGVDLLV